MSVRRELQFSLEKVDKDLSTSLAPAIKIQAVQTGIFESALLVADYYHPKEHRAAFQPHPTDPSTQSSAQLANHKPDPSDPTLTHYLSRTAHSAASSHKKTHPLRNLLCCPLAAVSFPSVSPEHMRAALSILAPKAPTFAAPTRRVNPGYYDPNVQQAVQKLMFLGARVEGRVFDNEGARSVGAIEGGMEGLRGQLVRILGEMGAGVTQALEGMGRSLWVTLEYRRENMQEEEEKEKPGE